MDSTTQRPCENWRQSHDGQRRRRLRALRARGIGRNPGEYCRSWDKIVSRKGSGRYCQILQGARGSTLRRYWLKCLSDEVRTRLLLILGRACSMEYWGQKPVCVKKLSMETTHTARISRRFDSPLWPSLIKLFWPSFHCPHPTSTDILLCLSHIWFSLPSLESLALSSSSTEPTWVVFVIS